MKIKILALFLLFFALDLNAKIIYVQPVQNAKYVSTNNNIIIGFDDAIISSDLNSLITVTGSKSGTHTGKVLLAEDGKKLIFTPHIPFELDEIVEVNINQLKTTTISNNQLRYSFQTQTRKIRPDYEKIMSGEMGYSEFNKMKFSGDYAVLPALSVTVSNNPSPGNLFINNYPTQGYPTHIRIARNDGSTEYAREVAQPTTDFNRQPNGLFVYFRVEGPNFTDPGIYYAEDSGFNLVDSFYCGNGYTTDGHDLRILNNGHALLMSYDPQPVDMSLIVAGGDPNAIVYGLIIQEIDENKNVVFQWRSWDHFDITDAIFENLTAATVDYVHGNAVELDNDGNLLISSRHLNEITKINRSTGAVIWRMGGVNNEFTFTNDTIPFHYQHDIRRIANGNVTLYDNGNFRTPSYSRALEYSLDEVNKTATKVWEYRNSPDIYGPFMGSVQRLKNGNTLIGWGGSNNTLTEVTPAGSIALEMSYPAGVWSYRVFRDEANLTLNMKIAIEGFYDPGTNQLNINDTVTAYIRSSVSPYGIIDSARSVVDSVNFNGNFRFYNVPTGVYYVSLKHRNGLETWSKAGGESFTLNGVYQYDLTSAASQAYGSNLALVGSKYCIYSGDTNQDGVIELSDVVSVSNNANFFSQGYLSTDVNGDNITDLSDLVITNNNANNFLEVIRP